MKTAVYCSTLLQLASVAAAQPALEGLGDIPGGRFLSRANAVSADGSTVVGESEYVGSPQFQMEGFRWRSGTGMTALGFVPGAVYSAATDCTADGELLVGHSGGWGAFTWTASGGFVVLPWVTPIEQFAGNYAAAVSPDGNVIVGTELVGQPPPTLPLQKAICWTSEGAALLGGPPGTPARHLARDVALGGQIVVGHFVPNQAFRWTPETGMLPLPTPWSGTWTFANAISDDGTSIVGQYGIYQEAFRWREATGAKALGRLTTTGEHLGLDVSADGSVAVGRSGVPPLGGAFVWDRRHGIRRLQQVLLDEGVTLTGWSLQAATGVSADGTRVCGYGINPDGNTEAFLATIPRLCLADWDDNGSVSSADIGAFLSTWFSELSSGGWMTDLNDSGAVNSADLTTFLALWFAALAGGC